MTDLIKLLANGFPIGSIENFLSMAPQASDTVTVTDDTIHPQDVEPVMRNVIWHSTVKEEGFGDLHKVLSRAAFDIAIHTLADVRIATVRGAQFRKVEHPRTLAWTDCPLLDGEEAPAPIREVEVVSWDRAGLCTVMWRGRPFHVEPWNLYTKLGRWKADGWYDGRGRWRRTPPMLLKRTLLKLPKGPGEITVDCQVFDEAQEGAPR